jgi:hypothetical protein
MISLKLMLTGIVLFILSVILANVVEVPRTATWWAVTVALIFLTAIVLFIGGGLTAIWVLVP